MTTATPESLKIGIALSGGGSRAIAFHLGCLRTLHRLGILERARVLSTVSGGSVIGAMYAVHEGAFDEFDDNVQTVLRTGFVWPAIRVAFTTFEGVKAAACFLMLIAAWIWLTPVRLVGGAVSWMFRSRPHSQVGGSGTGMPRRFASRTTILRRTFDDLLFKGKVLGALRTDGPRLVAIATELRTSSAFYFGRLDAGSWRFGKIDPSQISVAHAVAASAAYPLFLPAIDEFLTFRRRDASLGPERVTLTDGGVYDNLGLSPLWPDRDPEISIGVEKLDTIIACRAGYGLRTGSPSLFIKSRMQAVFGAIHSRAQNATMQRLFDLKKAGRLRNFVLPYLDQDDERLVHRPADLISRASVEGYPMDFSAMPEDWINKLSKRGEQLTLAVVREHAPELLPPGWDEGGVHLEQSRQPTAEAAP